MSHLDTRLIETIWLRLPYRAQLKLTDFFQGLSKPSRNDLLPPLPRMAIIDPINSCQLRCPLCPSDRQKYPKSRMDIRLFETILEQLPDLRVLLLFNWGEPLLHNELTQMIQLAVKRRILTIIHTNFSLDIDSDRLDDLVKSGLHQLIVSLDGLTVPSYTPYRVNGDPERVQTNMFRLMESKNRLRSRTPYLIWKYIVNRYNESELQAARKLARKWKIDFYADRMGLGDDLPDFKFVQSFQERQETWLPLEKKWILPHYQPTHSKVAIHSTPCLSLFRSITIHPDGRVSPCCWITDEANTWGDLKRESLSSIWRNDAYQSARQLFIDGIHQRPSIPVICQKCHIYSQTRRENIH